MFTYLLRIEKYKGIIGPQICRIVGAELHKEMKQLVTWMPHHQLRVGSNSNSPLCHHLSIQNSAKYMNYFECPLLKFYLCKIVGEICELILIFFQDILV